MEAAAVGGAPLLVDARTAEPVDVTMATVAGEEDLREVDDPPWLERCGLELVRKTSERSMLHLREVDDPPWLERCGLELVRKTSERSMIRRGWNAADWSWRGSPCVGSATWAAAVPR